MPGFGINGLPNLLVYHRSHSVHLVITNRIAAILHNPDTADCERRHDGNGNIFLPWPSKSSFPGLNYCVPLAYSVFTNLNLFHHHKQNQVE